MKSICFFSSYYTVENIPCYVKFYLEELKRHFTEIVFITNEKTFSQPDQLFIEKSGIQSLQVKNEGYDFGMWYKAFQKYKPENYDRVGLVNDSCILFGQLTDFFDWMDREDPDYCGYTDTYLSGYHLQSYFLVINKKAISFVEKYFTENGIKTNIKDVITTYEIGLSKYLMETGMKIDTYFKIPLQGQYSYALLHAKSLIKQGFPLVKKKIITRLYTSERWWSMVVIGFDPFPSHYIKLVKSRYKVPQGMFEELTESKGLTVSLKFNLISILAIIWGSIKNKRNMVKD